MPPPRARINCFVIFHQRVVARSRLAPLSARRRTTSRCPAAAAAKTGVPPCTFALSTSMLSRASSISTMGRLPSRAAWSSGVDPGQRSLPSVGCLLDFSTAWLTSSPAFSSLSTAAPFSLSTAAMRGNQPSGSALDSEGAGATWRVACMAERRLLCLLSPAVASDSRGVAAPAAMGERGVAAHSCFPHYYSRAMVRAASGKPLRPDSDHSKLDLKST